MEQEKPKGEPEDDLRDFDLKGRAEDIELGVTEIKKCVRGRSYAVLLLFAFFMVLMVVWTMMVVDFAYEVGYNASEWKINNELICFNNSAGWNDKTFPGLPEGIRAINISNQNGGGE